MCRAPRDLVILLFLNRSDAVGTCRNEREVEMQTIDACTMQGADLMMSVLFREHGGCKLPLMHMRAACRLRVVDTLGSRQRKKTSLVDVSSRLDVLVSILRPLTPSQLNRFSLVCRWSENLEYLTCGIFEFHQKADHFSCSFVQGARSHQPE